jgi:hypothetical protein
MSLLGGFLMRAYGSRLPWLALTALIQIACSSGGTSDGTVEGDDTGSSTTGDTGASTDDSSSTGDSSSMGDSSMSTDSTPDDTSGSGDTGMTTTDTSGCAPASCGTDTDCDGISDTIEGRFAPGGATDTDGDGTPDYKDDDSDNDGIPDRLEWRKAGCDTPIDDLNDSDGDGVPNFQDTDSDGNGLLDKDEVCPPAGVLTKLGMPACDPKSPYDFDGDGVPDYLDFDNDHDSAKTDKALGLSDKIELSDNTGKYVGLVDSDGDGVPDVYDIDSDNDFILDLEDGTSDDDGDKLPAFRDTDTDGDGVPDKCEGHGKAAPSSADALLPVLDTDGDGLPDFRDLDSDEDFLADGKEDVNSDCIVDATETDRLKADTDGDGVGDLPEVVLLGAAGAKDGTKTPAKAGKFFFVVPYSVDGSKKPSPDKATLALSTSLKQGDVAFIVDTTLSMEEEIKELRDSLSTKIIPELSKRFGDLGIAVAAHDDFPTSTESLAGSASLPFYIPTGGTVTTVAATSQAAAASLVTHQGGPLPESQVAAMMRALTGQALSWPEGTLAAVVPPAGTFGAVRFRTGSLPILVPITDASMHNGRRAKNTTPTGIAADYDTAYHHLYTFASPNIDNLVAKINELGAKVIGVASADIDRTAQLANTNMPYGDLAYLADKTGSYVPRSAFTGGTFSGCKTGFGGTAITEYTDGPGDTCRLVFSVGTNGAGLGNAIVEGVGALLNAIAFDVYVRASKDPADTTTVDPVDAFITSIEPVPTGGTDPVTGAICTTFSASVLKDKYNTPKALTGAGDIKETIGGLNPGKLYCFQVNPKPNTTVTAKTTPQEFKALLTVVADKPSGGSITLGSDREVLFIVPPTLN